MAGIQQAGGCNTSTAACRGRPRFFGTTVLAVLCALLAVVLSPPAFAGAQAERAVSLVKALVKRGEITNNATLRLVAKQGNLAAFSGQDHALKHAWEAATGTRLDIRIMAQSDLLPTLAQPNGELRGSDLLLARSHENADLLHRGLIADLAPLAQRLGFVLPESGDQAYLLLALQARVGGQLAAIPADLDVPLLYLRRDWLEDRQHRQRYRERHGRELVAPRTWAEYQDQVAYFNDPAAGVYGALEQRDPDSGWMFWLQRYVAMAPEILLFDEQMRPRLTTAAAVAATASYVAVVAHSAPEILKKGHDYSYTLPIFASGRGYSTISTMAAAKLFNLETSPVRDRYLALPLPGHEVAGQLRRRSALIYGNNLVIPQQSRNRLLAFLYAMWLTDPDVSLQSVGRAASFADPYRQHHLHDPRLRSLYGPMVLDAVTQALPGVVAAGLGLPGNADYLAALNRELWQAAAGHKSPAAAMQSASDAWEAITEKLGRRQQLEHLQRLRQTSAGRE